MAWCDVVEATLGDLRNITRLLVCGAAENTTFVGPIGIPLLYDCSLASGMHNVVR